MRGPSRLRLASAGSGTGRTASGTGPPGHWERERAGKHWREAKLGEPGRALEARRRRLGGRGSRCCTAALAVRRRPVTGRARRRRRRARRSTTAAARRLRLDPRSVGLEGQQVRLDAWPLGARARRQAVARGAAGSSRTASWRAPRATGTTRRAAPPPRQRTPARAAHGEHHHDWKLERPTVVELLADEGQGRHEGHDPRRELPAGRDGRSSPARSPSARRSTPKRSQFVIPADATSGEIAIDRGHGRPLAVGPFEVAPASTPVAEQKKHRRRAPQGRRGPVGRAAEEVARRTARRARPRSSSTSRSARRRASSAARSESRSSARSGTPRSSPMPTRRTS